MSSQQGVSWDRAGWVALDMFGSRERGEPRFEKSRGVVGATYAAGGTVAERPQNSESMRLNFVSGYKGNVVKI